MNVADWLLRLGVLIKAPVSEGTGPPAEPGKSYAHQSKRHAQRDSSAPTRVGSLLHRRAVQVTDCLAASLMSSQQRTGGPAATWGAKACEPLDFE